MEMVQNSLNWFEIPTSDFKRAKLFYSTIFDYEMPVMEMGPHWMGFLPCEQGVGIGGAIVSGQGYIPSKDGTLVYLNGGKDLSVVLNRIGQAGGKIVVPKTLITPELGYFATFIDSEGNKVALHSME